MWLHRHGEEIIISGNLKAFTAVLPNFFKRFWLVKSKWAL